MRYARAILPALMLLPTLLSGAAQDPSAEPFTVQVTITRTQSDGSVNTESNKVELQANGTIGQLRAGSSITMQLPNGQTVMQMVGNQLDCSLKPNGDGRYRLAITVTHRSAVDEAQASLLPQRIPGMPVFRNVIYAGTLILAEGQATEVTGPDLINNETLRIEIALSPRKSASGPSPTTTVTQPPAIPVKTQFVVTKTEGDKKTSAVYSVPTSTGAGSTAFRIGMEIPMAVSLPGPAGLSFRMQQVGTQIDQMVGPGDDGRFKLQETVTLRLLSPTGQFLNLVGAENALIVRDGERVQSGLIDKDTGETRAVDITVSAVK